MSCEKENLDGFDAIRRPEMGDNDFETYWSWFSTYCQLFYDNRFNNETSESDKFREKLFETKSNDERLRIVMNDAIFAEIIPKTVDQFIDEIPERVEQLDAKTLIDNIVDDGDYYKMIDQYSKAISLLLNDLSIDGGNDQFIGDCLIKRCELLFLMKHYEESLEDVNELKKYKLSEDHYRLLDTIEEKCKQFQADLINGKRVKQNDIRVKSESLVLESGHKDIEMVYDELKGRTVRVQNMLNERSVVTAESAFVSWLCPAFYSEYCNECLVMLNRRYVYCSKCFNVRYCSLECRQRAWNKYHYVECDHLEVLKDWAMGHTALRMAIIAGVQNAIKLAKEESISLRKWPEIGFRSNYESIRSLTGESFLSEMYLASAIIGTAFVTSLAQRMNLIDENSDDYYVFGSVIFKHMSQLFVNTYNVYDEKLKFTRFTGIFTTSEKPRKIGVGLYATSSLLSHSCDYNVDKFYCGDKLILVTNKSIAAGEELTVSYGGSSFMKNTIVDRHQFLMNNFGFTCQCTACESKKDCIACAYICENCNGPFVVNDDYTNHCVSCGVKDVDFSKTRQRLEEANEWMCKGDTHWTSGQIDEAKSCYKRAANLYKTVYFSPNTLYDVYNSLANCYSKLENFLESYKFKKNTISATKEVFGEKSLDLIHLYVECSQLLEKAVVNPLPKASKRKQKAQHFFDEALTLFSRISEFEFSTISENKIVFLNNFRDLQIATKKY